METSFRFKKYDSRIKKEEGRNRSTLQEARFTKQTEKQTIREFTDLKAWQEGHRLVIQIYKASKLFPRDETYSLVDQMRRAAASITSNIAEGFGRRTYKEELLFYYHAHGSLSELKNQLLIAKDVGYLKADDFNLLATQADTTHKLLQGLIKKSKEFLNHKS